MLFSNFAGPAKQVIPSHLEHESFSKALDLPLMTQHGSTTICADYGGISFIDVTTKVLQSFRQTNFYCSGHSNVFRRAWFSSRNKQCSLDLPAAATNFRT